MEWYVYRYDLNKNEIKKFNLFNHWKSEEDTKKNLKKYKNKEEFSEQLRKDVMYYFWSKSEYELIITLTEDGRVLLSPWCGCRNPEEATIDVTDDSSFDWRGFAEKHIALQIFKNEAKIDIYEQLMYVWDEFVDYVWDRK